MTGNAFIPVEEASIADIHGAYKTGITNACAVTQTFLDQIAAYDRKGLRPCHQRQREIPNPEIGLDRQVEPTTAQSGGTADDFPWLNPITFTLGSNANGRLGSKPTDISAARLGPVYPKFHRRLS